MYSHWVLFAYLQCVPVLDGVSACPKSHVSPCLPLSPHMCACVWWCVRLVTRGLVCPLDALSTCPACSCLPLSPHMCARLGCCVRLPAVLPPLVSHCLHTCVPVLDGVSAFPRYCLCLSPIVSHCLPTCVPVLAGASAFPTSCLPLRWLMRPPSRGLVCPYLLVFPHVCLRWMLCPPSRGLASACLPS